MRTRTVIATLGLALAPVVAATLPATPAAAAPPAAAHGRVVSENPIDNTPHVLNGRTEAVLDLGSRVIVGGTFTQVKRFSQPATFNRSYLFAYDKATGAIDTSFAPQPNGKVAALLRAPDGNILVAGQFKSIAGQALPYLAKLNPTTGAAVGSFTPSPNGMVYDMHLANGQLYIGGTFTKVRNANRTNFAVVDPANGAPRSTDIAFASAPRGTTRLMRLDVTPDGRKLVAIGNFARVGGQNRSNVAVLDLAANGGASVNGWNTDQYRDAVCGTGWDTIVYDVDISPDGRYFVIVTTGGPRGTSTLCDTTVRWELSQTGTASPTWRNYTGGDSLTSVAVTGAAVYIAGHHRWIDNPQGRDSKGPGALDRPGIAALDPATGRGLSWNPGRERGLVAPRLVATNEGLYVLSDSSKLNDEWHPRLSFLPLPGATTPPTPPTGPAVPPFATADAFTDRQYRDVTGRAPTSAQLTTWRNRLANGTPPAELISSLLDSQTTVASITRLYSAYFLRLPDTSGLNYWVDQSRRGKSLGDISQYFSSSPEFVQRYGRLGNRDFVGLIYRNVLDRKADATGLNFWTRKLDQGSSRGWVMVGFSDSDEYVRTTRGTTKTVTTYQAMLRRAPSKNERATWEPQLQGSTSRVVLVEAILALPAYEARV